MGHFLVTGGCGFIGSHLCESLIAGGHQVRVLDDLSNGKRANLAPGASLIVGSVTDPEVVCQGLADVDGCFHLAAIASVEQTKRQWVATHHVNTTGAITIFEAVARSSRKMPVVYASSAAVYGDCRDLPIRENAECMPLSAYGVDKVSSEMHARLATFIHDIPTTGLRFFNVYGPRQDPNSPYSGVISIFAERVRAGEPVTIYGDGRQTRDFVFVNDVVMALCEAMHRRLPGAPVFNVCTGISTSVLDAARRIADLCGMKLHVVFSTPRLGEIRHSVGSFERAADALGGHPTTELTHGLMRLLET